MGYDGRAQAAYGVRQYGLRRKLAVTHRVEHGGVGGEISAPAHADRGKYRYGVAVNPSGIDKRGYKAEGRAHGAEGRDGERHKVRIMETEQPFKYEINFLGKFFAPV